MTKVLILGKVWPEPKSSAAGSRLIQLMEVFKEQGSDLFFASPAQRSEFSFDPTALQVNARVLPINDTIAEDFFKSLQPDLVIFDRFTTEEQFGWRLAASCPDCIRILDTEDLHCLRAERQRAVKTNTPFDPQQLLSSEIAMREIASIYRCDLSLIISEYEMGLLRSVFKIDERLLHYIPMFADIVKVNLADLPSFYERINFVSIGNFLHDPNRDSVMQLHEFIWPLIRKKLPQAVLNVYGAYADDQILKLHNEKTGFLVKGRAANASDVLKSARVCLAFLRYGAGLKGKLLDAMANGTPNVTTEIGCEGMGNKERWSGLVEDDPEKFAAAAIELYNNSVLWDSKKNNIPTLLSQFDKKNHLKKFVSTVAHLRSSLAFHRQQNFIGALLERDAAQSTKYMALWIETKNKLASQQTLRSTE